METSLHAADPDGTPVPMMITPGTDAKALAQLGIPCYGFAPLRLDADTPFLSLFHGHDERVPVSALAFGLPVLADVVRAYAAGSSRAARHSAIRARSAILARNSPHVTDIEVRV